MKAPTRINVAAFVTSRVASTIDRHTGLGVNEYGCVCGWENPNGTERAQLEHAAQQVLVSLRSPRVTELARRYVRELLPDLPIGKDVTVAIAALSALHPAQPGDTK